MNIVHWLFGFSSVYIPSISDGINSVGWFLNLILNIRSPYFHFHLSLSHGQTLLLTLRSGDLLGSGGTKGKVLDYRSKRRRRLLSEMH